MSWIRRQWQRLREKILGEKASPEFIARGWAIGMFYGCAIPFGFQLILSIPTAILLKGSKIGATVATFVTRRSGWRSPTRLQRMKCLYRSATIRSPRWMYRPLRALFSNSSRKKTVRCFYS